MQAGAIRMLRGVWVQTGLTVLLAVGLAGMATAESDARAARDDLWVVSGFSEPLVATDETSAEQDTALAAAVAAFEGSGGGDFSALNRYAAAHPRSGWTPVLLANLGFSYYREGYFERSISALHRAWVLGKHIEEPRARAIIDRAFGELVRMHAKLGHRDEVRALVQEAQGRAVSGSASEAVAGAKDGLWLMENAPGLAYRCGPMAVRALASLKGIARGDVQEKIDAVHSTARGISLQDVEKLAHSIGLPHMAAYRAASRAIPVPSVVHWKLDHYAAITAVRDGRYLIEDPTFGDELWITADAINEGASGFFLIEPDALGAGWSTASAEQTSRVFGRGTVSTADQGATSQDDPTHGGDCGKKGGNPNIGMCGYRVHAMLVSLNLNDTPVGYAPAIGPPAYVTLTYSQRDAFQPAVPTFSNLGPKWTSNWLSYVTDSPAQAGASVSRYIQGGGSYSYVGFNTSTGAFTPETRDRAVLVRVSGSPIRYELRYKDGSKDVYGHSDGATAFPRRVFLSQVIDRAGNAVTLNYDAQRRLTSLTDAVGRQTTFSYDLPAAPLLLTGITDPFGRTAALAYDMQGRLSKITDVIGIESSFTYDAGSFVTALTTPYGTTRFAYAESAPGSTLQRSLTATDPLGFVERVEFRQAAPGISGSDAVLPQGMNIANIYLEWRNTFYWDKHAYQQAAGDYTKAYLTHWFHKDFGVAARSVESVKPALERRIWFDTPGSRPYFTGTHDVPSAIGRVLDDGTTQLSRIAYNATGNVQGVTDPLGRQTTYEYDATATDITTIRQKTSASESSVLAQFTYNSQHRPLTYTDAAGQVTRYAYNDAGQVTEVTNALGQTVKYEYDAARNLTRIINPNGKVTAAFTYDGFARVASRTDSEGHVVTFTYDALDRLVAETFLDGTSRSLTWDRLDLSGVTDREGRTQRFVYDANRNLVEVIDARGDTTRYDYYRNGALKSLTDSNGRTTIWDRDVQSRVTAKRYADGRATTVGYEAATGRVKSMTDARSQVKQFTYAADDRLLRIEYVNAANPTANVSYAYDAFFPRLVSMTDGTGTTLLAYHPPGASGALSVQKEDGPYQNDEVVYGYDALGRIVGRSVGPHAESFAYDTLGRLSSHNTALGNFVRGYLGESDQVTAHATPLVGRAWTYEGNPQDRRLKSINNSGLARDFQYVISAEDQIARIVESTGATTLQSWDYTYDATRRLTRARSANGTAFSYAYDAADNITSIQGPSGSRAGAYNSVNQVTSFGGKSFTYDANGNVTDDGERTYQWDAEDRLVGIKYKAMPTKETVFRYDGFGRRTAIVEKNGTFSLETRYQWCGADLCQARSAADVVIRRYFAEGEFRPVGGEKLYYAVDHLGSVRDVLLAASGARVAVYDYDPYGSPTVASGRVNADFRYAGMFRHNDSGLYLTLNRVYDSRTGRWLSRDPIGEEGGLNMYLYADADPVNKSDPLGLDAYMCTKPLDALGGSGSRSGPDILGNPFYHKYICVKVGNTTVCGGQDTQGSAWSPGRPSTDTFNSDTCVKTDGRPCMDNCLTNAIRDTSRPRYGLFGPGTNCQEWADGTYLRCTKQCKGTF